MTGQQSDPVSESTCLGCDLIATTAGESSHRLCLNALQTPRASTARWQPVSGSGTAMSIGQGAAEADVLIRVPRREWVTLRDPATWRRFGDAEHEASFQRIQRWWLAHRGQSWRPLPPEAPPEPVRR